MTAAEALSARDLVHVSATGVRRASAAGGLAADGFVRVAAAAGAAASVYPSGELAGLSGLVPGAALYLANDGALTMIPTTTTGHLVQPVGRAMSATTALVQPGLAITLAGMGG